MRARTRLVIADDHAVFRQGLKALLLVQDDMQVVGEADTVDRMTPTVIATRCEVLLLDLQMDRWAGGEIEKLAPLTAIVVLTASERVEDAMEALQMGAKAVVQKRFAVETLTEAIRAVAQGLVWIPPMLQAELAAQWQTAEEKRLTARESEIVQYVATGLRNAEIAQRLSITEGTTKVHLNKIFHKLGIRDRVELALYALRQGPVAVWGRKGRR